MPLSRNNPKAHKNDFGHVLILAGSRRMLGAAALTGLAAMRAGAGLTTIGVPKSLNTTLQKKISPVIMTWPLPETQQQSLAMSAFSHIRKSLSSFDAIAIGPGLSQNPQTQNLIRKIIENIPIPLVIDADALNALTENPGALLKNSSLKILTPHPGEMARLTGKNKKSIEQHRKAVALQFAKTYRCVLILKGHRTIVASKEGKTYINKTGNVGLATAGSGDVLTGILAALLGQGLSGFTAARYGVYLHGKAGEQAAKAKSKPGMIATDIIESIPKAFRSSGLVYG